MFDMVKAERFCHIYTGIEDSCEHGSRDEIPCGVWGRAPPIQISEPNELQHVNIIVCVPIFLADFVKLIYEKTD